MRVIGLGTQDSIGEAKQFIDDTGVRSVRMLWDGSSKSWRAFGVASQPAWTVVSKDGKKLDGWFGGFDEDRVLKLAARG